VDLGDRLTWLQSDGTISYGPVRMEPGPPGSSHATPRGTFHVAWKAGAHYLSAEYGEAMPYAVFFAEGGIAFHGGSLNRQSHGCIHLSIDSARYYYDHLPVGAEVAVFGSPVSRVGQGKASRSGIAKRDALPDGNSA
jgi:lipoprotein-anchoring transpeptidase ErfK/SrfK